MSQADRDRLVALKKAASGATTQRQAAEELALSERQVRRLLRKLRAGGDANILHALRDRRSNRKMDEETRQQAITILQAEVYRGFGPTLASEYLASQHRITVSKETVRQWMKEAGLWKAQKRRMADIRLWRPRRERYGELVQWDTSLHDWLEGRGELKYLILMIDDATSLVFARFVERDSTETNLWVLREYLQRHGRPLAFYTDKSAIFQVCARKDPHAFDGDPWPPTQLGRALGELSIERITAHSPQAKGRIERSFQTAQDRLVKGMRVAGVKTIEQANAYLQAEYLPHWNAHFAVPPACAEDAHRPLGTEHDLAAILCPVFERTVTGDYTIRFAGKTYQIPRADIRPGLRGSRVRIEQRDSGELAVRFGRYYLGIHPCAVAERLAAADPAPRLAKPAAERRKSDWMQRFYQSRMLRKPGSNANGAS